jgi:hypothetical protein
VALTPRRHAAAFETVSQIGIANFVEDSDDLLLVGVCHFHLSSCGHAAYLCAGDL